MTAEKVIELLTRLIDEQDDGVHGEERRVALAKAIEALKYLERTKQELERRLNDGR